MKKYEFSFKEKVSCWVERKGTVNADNIKVAREKILNDSGNIDVNFDDNYYMIETEDRIELNTKSVKMQEIW